jgi:hypothetical protein
MSAPPSRLRILRRRRLEETFGESFPRFGPVGSIEKYFG